MKNLDWVGFFARGGGIYWVDWWGIRNGDRYFSNLIIYLRAVFSLSSPSSPSENKLSNYSTRSYAFEVHECCTPSHQAMRAARAAQPSAKLGQHLSFSAVVFCLFPCCSGYNARP